MKQDEWVVCRVFQKSAGAKKYPSNQSRAVNPYSLEMGSSVVPSQMMQAPENYQFPVGRNYMNQAELAELTRAFRAGGSSSVNLPVQSQMNYPLGVGGGCFTISGLNINLGGAPTQPVYRPMQPPQVMNQQDVSSSMMTSSAFAAEGGYVAEINNPNGASNRFMGVDHCMDFDNYWPSY